MDQHINRAFEWVSPNLQPWVLIFLMLSSLTAFTLSAWPKLQLLRKAGKENRTDQPLKRIFTTLSIAFGQTRLLKEPKSGWMHAVIFWGFLILLVRAGEFFFIGLFPNITSHFSATAFLILPYLWVKDGVVFMVTLAVLYALYRRLVVKPDRLTLSIEGLAILGLILVIVTSDVLFDSTFLALNPDIEKSGPLAALFAPLVILAGNDLAGHLHSLAYWTHVSAILFFLTLLPRSKHFHILTAIPNVFLSHLNPGNGLRRIDFEDDEKETFGVTQVESFTWKQMLDLHTCTQCGRCDRVCPALATGKPLSPQQLTVNLRDHLNSPPGSDMALLGDVIEDEVLWACTTCGACESACPVMIQYVDKVIDLRRGLVLTEDRYPKELESAFKSLETQSNPWGFPKNSRADWAKALDIPIWDKTRPTEYLYFIGCNGSFDTRGKQISESVVKALKQARVSFSILGNSEGCTGDPARRAGNEYLFDMLASQNTETFQQQGVLKVITHCPHCLNSLKNEYPEFGVYLEVIHHSELLETLIADGKISLGEKTNSNVVVHDSCYLGRHNGVYDAPRKVLAAEVQNVQEVEQSRENGTCCGAGGARFLLEENTGTRMSHHRLDELMVTNPDTIAVSCPYCVLMLEDAVKAKGLEGQVKVRDIGEMIK
ncbi:MAG: 4Fe-4S dicluster domain-containing protein [Nitrospinae bacterium]|nr:4Fe-4S dicluster domain-containing protein [Nitrospinota bacterium]MBL7019766.1 4Fe-4S dicluster domain-containing protein [Nitrospinaceae bacterium]